ncbi:MAG: hypothetical protein LBJ57_06895, partial [Prevotellaceae bacterium]|nr:hypothetical protein [Prevotellaceae bacterium]
MNKNIDKTCYLKNSIGKAKALIRMVIFNHKAESPTFVIAIAGVTLWFVHSKKSTLNIMLFAC